MFSVVLQGGLGNRLFQIAMGLGYERKHNLKFVLSPHIIRDYRPEQKGEHSYFLRNIETSDNIFKQIYFSQPCYYYDIPKYENVYFDGYFQSEKYFKHIRPQIIEQFGCPKEIKTLLLNKYPFLPNSIFLHIRRGDYVNNPFHDINLTKYYDYCLKQFSDVTVVICSDDKDWCKEKYPDFYVLDENEVITLWIMSLCGRGGICANSSFSWWGAWLNENENLRFFYPNKQFNDESILTNDLYSDNLTIINYQI